MRELFSLSGNVSIYPRWLGFNLWPLFPFASTFKTFCFCHIKWICSFSDWTQLQFGNRLLKMSTWGKNRALLSHVAFENSHSERWLPDLLHNWQKRWLSPFFPRGVSGICHLSKRLVISSLKPVHRGRVSFLNLISVEELQHLLLQNDCWNYCY